MCITELCESGTQSRKYCFKISLNDGSSHIFAADSEEQRQEWVSNLQEVSVIYFEYFIIYRKFPFKITLPVFF